MTMPKKKLSERAILILMAIRDKCNWPVLDRHWIPGDLRGMSDRVEELSLYVNISGPGDAKILRSLKERGLIARPRPNDGSSEWPSEYYFDITEDGVVAIEEAREAGRLQHWIDEAEAQQQRLRMEERDES